METRRLPPLLRQLRPAFAAGFALALFPVAPAEGAARAASPDLTVVQASVSPVSRPGGVLRIRQRLANTGPGAARATSVAYYLSRDSKVGPGDILVGSRPTGRLRPRTVQRADLTARVPATTPASTYALILCADSARRVGELNERNNCRAALQRVSIAEPPRPPAITEHPADPTNSQSARFAFSGGARFLCSRDGSPFASCASPVEMADFGEGQHGFRVRAVDAEGRIGEPAAFGWFVDRTPPPAPTFTSSPRSPSNDRTASHGFGSTDAAAYRCSFEGGAFENCRSPALHEGVPEGTHTFTVVAIDAAGNESAPATQSWIVDLTPPAAPSITGHPAAVTNSRTAAFSFAAADPGDSVLCRVDEGAFRPCASPETFEELAEGARRFELKAVDLAGNEGLVRSHNWTTDYTAPAAPTVSERPPAQTFARVARFGFGGAESGLTFTCSLGSAGEPCSSPVVYSRPTGAYSFSVSARDAAGNLGPAARVDWRIDRREDGVYRGPGGPAAVLDFETWLGRSVTRVLASLGTAGWSGIQGDGTSITTWNGTRYKPVFAVPMLPSDGSTLAQGAAGAYDHHFRLLAERLVANGQSDAVIRIGWEFNGDWFPWKVTTATAPAFVTYWRRIVTAMRGVAGAAFTFEWAPNQGRSSGVNVELAYPGDAYVDYVGLTAFDIACCEPGWEQPEARWEQMLRQQNGLQWQRDFAAAHGKPMTYSEWGLWKRADGTGGGDNPYYIARFREWIDANNVAFTMYFEHDGDDGPHRLMTTRYPNGALKFKELFAAPLP